LVLFFSDETLLLGMPVELFRARRELFGDLAEEKEVFRLKPDGALDVVELKVDSSLVAGDPLLVPGLVVTLVDVLSPNICPPFNPVKSLRKPLLELERCILAQCVQRFGPSQGRLSINRGSGPSIHMLETISNFFQRYSLSTLVQVMADDCEALMI
jgi:hypothetical protein